ncbi:MAG: hypothetical protein WC389_17320 [Lutibacter sp.]|jgi:hypothetical protein
MENKIDLEALQKKLQKFVGFKEMRFDDPPHEVAWIEDKDGHMFTDGVPDLVNDAKVQQDYLYTKIVEKFGEKLEGIGYIYDDQKKQWSCLINLYSSYGIYSIPELGIYSENLAVAFALACEKLIDSLKESNGRKY